MTETAERAEQVVAQIIAALGRAKRGVVVDSPPGAGKSTLVVRAAVELADAGETVMVIAQTNEQVDDLTDRLARGRPLLAVGRLASSEYVPSGRVMRHRQVTVATKAADLAGCQVVLSTAHKWATVSADASWPWAIVDVGRRELPARCLVKPAQANSGANPSLRLAPVGDGATAEAAEMLMLAPQARTAVPPQWSPNHGSHVSSGTLPDKR